MTARPTVDWRELFGPSAPGEVPTTVELNAVRRGGQPFLFLPAEPRLAARALALYPAQTAKAQAAKGLLKFMLRLGLKPRLARISLSLAADEPFARFLACLVTATSPPRFAILAGNPRAEGRRFVFLVFDCSGKPTAVVKAGSSVAARRLLEREENFLQTAPLDAQGLPRVRATFDSARVRAFAMGFFAGDSPGLDDTVPLAELLTSWIAKDKLVAMSELGEWQRLEAAARGSRLPEPVLALAGIRFHPTLTHGDCAPWNVKAAGGRWTLLDWERGELAGVPGWDWFHFVMQPAVLVRREPVPTLLARFEQLLTGVDFARYAQHAGIAGNERVLALSYLCYCTRVTRQADGLETVAELERAATKRWFR
jgi:hypothetical protein